ncbi:MAG: precorrin-6y C5,15-methyltransferase (decarboxylating) subunit CbiE [Deltaproteobacteria bacterium]|nr:precorrin-6y C5,15-methyltransferase (decarboxylating) subunit CbiE [Deltaproteobacteria bacterium]
MTGPEKWEPPVMVLVGVGVGPGDLTGDALRWIARGQVIAGAARHLGLFPEHPGRRIAWQSGLEPFLERLDEASRYERTVMLASGDPLFFGIGSRLIRQMGRDRVVIVPGITSVQALFGRLREPWEDVRVLSLHGREEEGLEWKLLYAVGRYPRLAVFTDPVHTPGWIARKLLDAGVAGRRMVVAEDLGQATENIGRYSLEEVLLREFSSLNLVAVFCEERSGRRDLTGIPVFGFSEEMFQHEAGLITKVEVRALVLASLQLGPGQVLWDLGAGSGSVSIEASRIAPLGRVIAVERDENRIRDLRENLRRFQCYEISAVHGNALDVMDGLPDPDRVFVGGSGGELERMLGKLSPRLRPGGRVVQTAVTLETLETARRFWKTMGMEVSVTQLHSSRSTSIGGSVRLDAMNPVFVITAFSRGVA